eukprot:Seg97.9 transcript_id=Seg97.9/GoldUCD/mRNA.D3Y31 product="putative protein C11orf65" protein_id=Seg97.9/GoldUCD/D3Y31
MITTRELTFIAQQAGFLDLDSDSNNSISKADLIFVSKSHRLDFIRNPHDFDKKMVATAAAIEVQRSWRGYKIRSNLFGIVNPKLSTKNLLSNSKHPTGAPSITLTSKKSSKLDATYQMQRDLAISRSDSPLYLLPFKEFCASIIQQWWRKLHEKQLQKLESHGNDVSSSRSSFDKNFVQNSRLRIELTETPSEDIYPEEYSAACVIQRSWRKHVDQQVYKYYKDLISFKSIGNPSLMLKCINPRESDLLDAASGVHIRFRLGGEHFPPNVYYKIFTNRNIADICAFAPRDYTKTQLKNLPMKFIHNKGVDISDHLKEHQNDWYQRWENNGWRLVSDKMIKHVYQDRTTFTTSNKKVKFHHSKLVRQEDIEKRRKKKKIDWMNKMYRDGALKSREETMQSLIEKDLIESTTKEMDNAAKAGFESAIEEWEVDELLNWTNALNFDEYISDWKLIGTTTSTAQSPEETIKDDT